MTDDLPFLLLVLSTENAAVRQRLATVQDTLVEIAIDAGHLHGRIEAVQTDRDAWRETAERLATPASIRAPGRLSASIEGKY